MKSQLLPLSVLIAVGLLNVTPATATTLTATQVAQAAYSVGFRGGALVNSVAIADAESGFLLEAECLNCMGVTEDSCGLWQINIDVHPEYYRSSLLSSASYNASAAYSIADAAVDANWTPWSTFMGGQFESYLATARIAAENIDSTVIRASGDMVTATTGINVRPTAGNSSVTRVVSSGTIGTVLAGPVVSVIGSGSYPYVWWQIHWNDGGADGWSVEDYMSRVSTTVPVTIATVPVGLSIIVDGVSYLSPQTFNWAAGSQHSISAASPQYSADSHTKYAFLSWNDGGAQSHAINVPAAATAYTANFSTQYLLNTAASPAGAGTITVNPTGPWFNPGQSVVLTAVPGSGYAFSYWSGEDSYSGNSASVTVNGYRSVTAGFILAPVAVTIATAPSGLQVVVDGYNYSSPQTFSWTPGSSHSVSATAPQYSPDGNTKYNFNSWNDGQAQTHTVSPSSPATFTATYSLQYQLGTSVSPSGSGTITPSPSGPWYDPGQGVTLTANPATGYRFRSWSGVDSQSGPTSSVIVNGYRRVTADFGFVPSPPMFSGISSTNGVLSLTLSGLSSGTTAVLMGSPDLKAWSPLQTNVAGGTTTIFTVPVGNMPMQFFRAVLP